MPTLTLPQIQAALRHSWGPDTCDPVDLDDWRPDNPARGQCGVTALVIADLLGGDLLVGKVFTRDGTLQGYHWWNRLPDGTELDLTREQFRDGETITAGTFVPRPNRSPTRCREQYELLRRRVLSYLNQPDDA